jgi:FkbM family methyltransferase
MKQSLFTDVYPFIDAVFPTWEHAVVFELGAHKGTDTLKMASKLTPPYHYFAFEPDRRNLPELTAVAKQLGPQVEVYPRAVCEKAGVMPFHFSGGRAPIHAEDYEHTDSGSLMEPNGILWRYPWMKFFGGTVRTISIDEFCAYKGLAFIDFIWMDIQGAELRALNGAAKMLPKTHYLYEECYRSTNLYDGQPTYEDFVRCLGKNWITVFRTATDVLFENTAVKGNE